MTKIDEKVKRIIRDSAATYLSREAGNTSLITVTDVELEDRGSTATIFLSVLPNNKEKQAMDFVKRKRSEFREYIKSNTKLSRIPFIDFEIDLGERNRQRIDEISLGE